MQTYETVDRSFILEVYLEHFKYDSVDLTERYISWQNQNSDYISCHFY